MEHPERRVAEADIRVAEAPLVGLAADLLVDRVEQGAYMISYNILDYHRI